MLAYTSEPGDQVTIESEPTSAILSTFLALETIGWWSSERTAPSLLHQKTRRTAVISQPSRIAS